MVPEAIAVIRKSADRNFILHLEPKVENKKEWETPLSQICDG
jgi:hypothetical protein